MKKAITNPKEMQQRLIKLLNEQSQNLPEYALVAMDGTGKVRTFVDYHKIELPDPNRFPNYDKFLSTFADMKSARVTEDYLGNRNLFVPTEGVGSSLKPIVYAAVLSKTSGHINWDRLAMKPYTNLDSVREIPKHGRKPELRYFAARPFSKGAFWRNIPNDEYTSRGLTSNTYLSESNNLFHGLVLMLGSQHTDTIPTLFSTAKVLTRQKHRETALNFPTIQYNGAEWVFEKERAWLFDEMNTPLSDGLYDNFGLVCTSNQQRPDKLSSYEIPKDFLTLSNRAKSQQLSEDVADKNPAERGRKGLNFKHKSGLNWSFPEKSHFYQADRRNNPIEIHGLTQPTLGADPVRITPIKMAEMGLKLFTLNRQTEAQILRGPFLDNSAATTFDFDIKTSGSKEDFFKQYQRLIFASLYETPRTGTAKGLRTWVEQLSRKNIFVYCKTGTATVEDDVLTKKERDSKYLLVALSNKKLQDIPSSEFFSQDENQRPKIYIIYLSLYNQETTGDSFRWGKASKILDKVIESPIFKQYFKIL